MENERYNWMWSKRKEGFNSHVLLSSSPSYGDSWEEQAFAEDAAGPLGGCIWPPRSYTCTFCRREFRSAQALGGHMNVHRRDRARLKQSPSLNNNLEMLQHQPNQILNPSQNICLSMVSNPNSDHLDHAFLAPPSSISSRVSILPTPNINDKKSFLFPSSSPFAQENLKSIGATPFSSWSKLDPEKSFQIQGLEIEKGSKVFESNCITKKNQVNKDLSTNLSLVIRKGCEMGFDDKDDDDVVVLGCKRRRIDETLSFFPKRVSVDRDQPESEVLDEQSPSSTENLDLELRLGDRPK